MKLLNRKLTLKKDLEIVCEITKFVPKNSSKELSRYGVHVPEIGELLLSENVVLNLFDFIPESIPKKKEGSKNISKISERRAELKSLTKADLLEVVEEKELEDEIASSLNKEPLIEEILKNEFSEEDYEQG